VRLWGRPFFSSGTDDKHIVVKQHCEPQRRSKLQEEPDVHDDASKGWTAWYGWKDHGLSCSAIKPNELGSLYEI